MTFLCALPTKLGVKTLSEMTIFAGITMTLGLLTVLMLVLASTLRAITRLPGSSLLASLARGLNALGFLSHGIMRFETTQWQMIALWVATIVLATASGSAGKPTMVDTRRNLNRGSAFRLLKTHANSRHLSS